MSTAATQIDALWAGLNDPDTGQSYSGAIVGFFLAGTTTPKVVWYDKDKTLPTVAGVSQITLDSNGSASVFGDGAYKINIYDPEDTGLATPLSGSIDGCSYADTDTIHSGGDVTGGVDLTIAADAVTYAKMQNVVADNVILGNDSGAGSIVQELSATEVRTLINVENGATADQSDAEIKTAYENNADTNAYSDAELAKVGYISVTQAVNLDTMESNIATNNAKVTNATHTGEVTGSGALTIADDIIDEANLKMEDAGSNGKVLSFNSAKDGGLEWIALPSAATISDAAYVRVDWNGNTTDAASKNALSDTFYNMVRYLNADTGGNNCTLVGNTGNTTMSGNFNLAVSHSAMASMVGGQYNIAMGYTALTNATVCSRNIAIGMQSMYDLTTADASDNIGIGYDTLARMNNNAADKNVGIGNFCLDALTSGYEQTAVGYNSGTAVTTGFGGIHIGSGSGASVTTANDTISIGRGISALNGNNRLAIGRTDGGNTWMTGYMLDSGGSWTVKANPYFIGILGNTPTTAVNGTLMIEFTDNTTVKFKGRGSDGVTRSGTVALS